MNAGTMHSRAHRYFLATLLVCATAGAQPYPVKPIRWVTGGGPDAMARIMGQKFTDA